MQIYCSKCRLLHALSPGLDAIYSGKCPESSGFRAPLTEEDQLISS